MTTAENLESLASGEAQQSSPETPANDESVPPNGDQGGQQNADSVNNTDSLDADEPEVPEWMSTTLVLWICTVLIGIALIKSFVIEVYVVVGDSMDPTLKNRQHLLVNKLSTTFDTVDYGDILVFRHPDYPEKHLIKRVIACPGDVIKIKSGQVYLKPAGAPQFIPLPEPYLADYRRSPSTFQSEIEVPRNHYFVLGDNRNNSRDSRHFGTVHSSRIIGETFMIIWPRSDIEFK